ncbi:MAG: signal recognition particle-docking protein FtsY [Tepidiformaceae bacterium]
MRFWRKKPNDQSLEEEAAESAASSGAVAAGEPDAVEFVAGLEATEEEAEEVREQTQRATERTRRGFFSRLGGIFERADFDDSLWDDLEEVLLASDAGLETTTDVLAAVRARVKDEGAKQSARVREILREELITILALPGEEPPAWARPDAPPLIIVLVVGVNGAGKTTSIAKMSYALKRDGASVVLGAADTFRAAATDQLKVWGERIGVRVVAHQSGADPGAVVFDTLSAAEGSKADFVIIDTAGRLHTKTNLMDELKKMDRIIQRNHPDGPHETILVLDATTGQNGLMQAKTFAEAVGVTGIILAKLDGTAKGGIAFAIAHELGIPVRFIGTGERMEDLAPFDARDFVDALLN